jgi:dTDP-4-amino-4,6-dideoxygalactose transaminase
MKTGYLEVLDSLEIQRYSRRSVVAPNRLETRYRDFFVSILQAWHPNALTKLRDELRDFTGRQHIFFAPSCRAAIAQVLSALPHSEVVLPAYTCPVVKTGVQVAGKRIIYVDIAKASVNATSAEFAEQAKPGRVLIPTHIFGFPTDIEAICDLAKTHDCVTIEDAAAALGARRNGRLLGTFGDIGVFSFERSKRIPAFRGAAIIINNEEILDPAKRASSRLVETKRVMPIKDLAFAMVHNAATAPWFYGRFTLPQILRKFRIPDTYPIVEDLEFEKRSPFYVQELQAYQASLILHMLKKIDKIRSRIGELVSAYRHTLEGTSIMTYKPPKCDDEGLMRFPVAFPGRDRSEILRMGLNHGLFLETNYEQPLPEEHEASRFPNSVWAARNLVLLPLYTRLSYKDAEQIAKKIVEM